MVKYIKVLMEGPEFGISDPFPWRRHVWREQYRLRLALSWWLRWDWDEMEMKALGFGPSHNPWRMSKYHGVPEHYFISSWLQIYHSQHVTIPGTWQQAFTASVTSTFLVCYNFGMRWKNLCVQSQCNREGSSWKTTFQPKPCNLLLIWRSLEIHLTKRWVYLIKRQLSALVPYGIIIILGGMLL